MDTVFWVAPLTSNWNNINNWSLISGGPGGAPVPGLTKIVVFDQSGTGNCLIDAPVGVYDLNLVSGFTGKISQNSYPITVINDASFMSGTFEGGSASVSLKNFYLYRTDCTSTSDVLHIKGEFYFKEDSTSVFIHNEGQTSFDTSGNSAFMGGIRFKNLIVQDGGSYLNIDSSCFVEGSLSLESGYLLKNSDATVHVQEDMTSYSDFGRSGTGCAIMFDSIGPQDLLYNGGILPTLIVNKQVSDHVRVYGNDPLQIDGDLVILDGTFNTNNHDVFVGIL